MVGQFSVTINYFNEKQCKPDYVRNALFRCAFRTNTHQYNRDIYNRKIKLVTDLKKAFVSAWAFVLRARAWLLYVIITLPR